MTLYRSLVYPLIDYFRRTDALATYEYLREAQWQSPEVVAEAQRQALVRLLQHCGQHVPFYQQLFARHSFVPSDDCTLDAFRRLPIIEKKIIRENREAFKADNIELFDPRINTTGGTTSYTLHHYISRATHSSTIANILLQWDDAGYQLGEKMILLGGSSLYPSLGSVKAWLYNRLQNVIPLSSFDITPRNLTDYAMRIRRSGARFLRGYASAIYTLARHMVKQGIEGVHLEVIFTTAETLFPEYRQVIEEAFGCQVFNEYGARDGGVLAFECSEHAGLHINAYNCLVEIVDDQGMPVPVGESGHLMLTSLDNYAFPFLRYRIGDIGTLTDERCPCGRGLPLLKEVKGRSGDFVVGPNGLRIHSEFFSHIFWQFPTVSQYQVIQDTPSGVTLRLVVDGHGLSASDQRKITAIVQRRAGPNFEVKIELVDNIPPAPSGKWKYVISTLNK